MPFDLYTHTVACDPPSFTHTYPLYRQRLLELEVYTPCTLLDFFIEITEKGSVWPGGGGAHL